MKRYTITFVSADGVQLPDSVDMRASDRAAIEAARGLAKGHARINGDITWTVTDASGRKVLG
jgi:hypothetical protein